MSGRVNGSYDAQTLEASEDFVKYYEWLLRRIGGEIRGRTLEVGSGTGTMSDRIEHLCSELVLVEPAANLCAILEDRFTGHERVVVRQGTLESVVDGEPDLFDSKFDTVVSFNVLEHIEDDVATLRSARNLLRPGGRLVLFVPSLPFLYGSVDAQVDHIRRYTRRSLRAAIASAGPGTRSHRILRLPGNGALVRRRASTATHDIWWRSAGLRPGRGAHLPGVRPPDRPAARQEPDRGRPPRTMTSISIGTRRRIVLARLRRMSRMLLGLASTCRCALSYGKDLDRTPVRVDFQNLQADAFLAGRLDLRLVVPAGLLALDDPYDAAANQDYREQGLHDLTLYDDKIYAYFGPAPVVLLLHPVSLLHVGDLSPTLACLIFCAAGFLASVGVFRTVSRRFLPPLSTATEAVSILALGFGAPIGWLIYIGRGYEVPIACGYFLVFRGPVLPDPRAVRGARHVPSPNLPLGQLSSRGRSRRVVRISSGRSRSSSSRSPILRWGDGQAADTAVGVDRVARPVRRGGRRAGLVQLGPVRLDLRVRHELHAARGKRPIGPCRRVRRSCAGGSSSTCLSPARRRPGFPGLALRPASFPLPTELNYLREPVAGLLPNMPASLLGIVGLFAAWRSRRLPRANGSRCSSPHSPAWA